MANTDRKAKAMRNILKLSSKSTGGAMSLTMALQGLALAGGETFGQLQKMSASDTGTGADNAVSLPSPAAEGMRLSLKERIPASMHSKLLALSSLARSILNDPRAAQSFSADPAGYLAERGLGDVSLDLGSHEVKVVLALGDEEVRAAAAKGDKAGYLKLMEDRGLLRFNGLDELGFQDTKDFHADIVVFINCIVMCHGDTTAATHSDSSTVIAVDIVGASSRNLLNSLDSKAAILMWGRDGAMELLKQHVANKADELAESIIGLKIAKEKNLTKEQIKAVIERKLLEAMAD